MSLLHGIPLIELKTRASSGWDNAEPTWKVDNCALQLRRVKKTIRWQKSSKGTVSRFVVIVSSTFGTLLYPIMALIPSEGEALLTLSGQCWKTIFKILSYQRILPTIDPRERHCWCRDDPRICLIKAYCQHSLPPCIFYYSRCLMNNCSAFLFPLNTMYSPRLADSWNAGVCCWYFTILFLRVSLLPCRFRETTWEAIYTFSFTSKHMHKLSIDE